jgi:carbon storage regulator
MRIGSTDPEDDSWFVSGRRFPMLVLTRRIGERIVIDHQIVLEVLEVKGNRIRLGIQAPSDVSIVREELLLRPIEVEGRDLSFGKYAGTRR